MRLNRTGITPGSPPPYTVTLATPMILLSTGWRHFTMIFPKVYILRLSTKIPTHQWSLSYLKNPRSFSGFLSDTIWIATTSHTVVPIKGLFYQQLHKPMASSGEVLPYITPFTILSNMPQYPSDTKPIFLQIFSHIKNRRQIMVLCHT